MEGLPVGTFYGTSNAIMEGFPVGTFDSTSDTSIEGLLVDQFDVLSGGYLVGFLLNTYDVPSESGVNDLYRKELSLETPLCILVVHPLSHESTNPCYPR